MFHLFVNLDDHIQGNEILKEYSKPSLIRLAANLDVR
jgi:hypothetical protein